MKKLLQVFLLSTLMYSFPQASRAQGGVHLSIGLNGSYAGLDSLNYVIEKFNADNEDFVKPLRDIHTPGGIYLSAGGNFNRLLIDLSFTMRTQGSRARGNADIAGTEERVQLRYNAHTFDVGIGYFFVDKAYTQVALGLSLDFGQTRLLARRGTAQQVATFPWARMTNELNFASTIFLQARIAFQDDPRLGLYLRPYYQFGFVQNDFGQVNRFLRPNEWQSDPFFILQRPSNVGLKVGLYIGT